MLNWMNQGREATDPTGVRARLGRDRMSGRTGIVSQTKRILSAWEWSSV